MNAFAPFPATLHWNAQQLTDAVPPRLHELFAFDATHATTAIAANAPRHARRDRAGGYLQSMVLPSRFRIL